MTTWQQFKNWLGRLLCQWLDYEPPPKGILLVARDFNKLKTVSGGSNGNAYQPPPVVSPMNFTPDILLAMNNTLVLAANNVYSMKFPHGNRMNIANVGNGKLWFRVDGHDTAVNDVHSELLPPGVADNDVVFSHYMSIVSDAGTTISIRCQY